MVYPLARDYIGTVWFGNELPSGVIYESREFRAHGFGPREISKRISIIGRNW
jgi:hypothetical protein